MHFYSYSHNLAYYFSLAKSTAEKSDLFNYFNKHFFGPLKIHIYNFVLNMSFFKNFGHVLLLFRLFVTLSPLPQRNWSDQTDV